jgi:hypothetical protein
MGVRMLSNRSARVLAVLLLAGAGAGLYPAAALALPGRRPSGAFSMYGVLYGVAAFSGSDAWAVGYAGSHSTSEPLIARWNGKAWKRVPGPRPGPGSKQ